MQTDVVSGVEQFDQWAARNVAELRLSSFTDGAKQHKQQWFDKNMDSGHDLHCDVSVLSHWEDEEHSQALWNVTSTFNQSQVDNS